MSASSKAILRALDVAEPPPERKPIAATVAEVVATRAERATLIERGLLRPAQPGDRPSGPDHVMLQHRNALTRRWRQGASTVTVDGAELTFALVARDGNEIAMTVARGSLSMVMRLELDNARQVAAAISALVRTASWKPRGGAK
jgi:hypothetical protein